MVVTFVVFGLVFAAAGVLALLASATVFGQLMGLVCLVIAAIFIVGAGVIEELRRATTPNVTAAPPPKTGTASLR